MGEPGGPSFQRACAESHSPLPKVFGHIVLKFTLKSGSIIRLSMSQTKSWLHEYIDAALHTTTKCIFSDEKIRH